MMKDKLVTIGHRIGSRVVIENPRLEPYGSERKFKVLVRCDCGITEDTWLSHCKNRLYLHECEETHKRHRKVEEDRKTT